MQHDQQPGFELLYRFHRTGRYYPIAFRMHGEYYAAIDGSPFFPYQYLKVGTRRKSDRRWYQKKTLSYIDLLRNAAHVDVVLSSDQYFMRSVLPRVEKINTLLILRARIDPAVYRSTRYGAPQKIWHQLNIKKILGEWRTEESSMHGRA